MADNVTLPGTGDVIAADDVGGFKIQRMKPQIGPDGSAADVSETRPMPTIPGHPSTKVLTQVAIATTTSGDQTIISATAAQTSRIHKLVLTGSGATVLSIKSAASVRATLRFMGAWSLVLDFQGEPHFVTGTNEAFILSPSTTINIDGWADYEKSA